MTASRSVDLNADMGEGFGPWRMGDDAGLMELVTSASVACGFHAGDPDVMAQTMAAAAAAGVAVGAHPGFADLQGFGRRRLTLSRASLRNLLHYQIGAARAVARGAGTEIAHVKLHGALANMAAEDAGLAEAAFAAALEAAPGCRLYVLAGTAQERAARTLGADWAGEIFADRAYSADGTLVDRSRAGAVIDDPVTAAARVVSMVRSGAILTATGDRLPARIDTVCLHGDTPGATTIARAVRAALDADGVAVRAPGTPPRPAQT